MLENDLGTNDADADAENLGQMEVRKNGKVIDLFVPILALIVFTIIAMLYTGGAFSGQGISPFEAIGNTDASLSLVLGGLLTLVFTMLFYLPRRVLSFRQFMGAITSGVKSMVPAYIILILAWTIGGICDIDHLNTGGFVGHVVNDNQFPVFVLPIVLFVVAGFLGFATGTSWGTMALLIPIGSAICVTDSTSHLLIPIFGAILAGAVYGDHISPISDTTILSSTGAGCPHLNHVASQMPYATLVAGACCIGYLCMGFLSSPWIPLIVSAALVVLGYFVFGKRMNPDKK